MKKDNRYSEKSKYFQLNELAKIVERIPDFIYKVHFDICDIVKYDEQIYSKLKDESLYTLVADINLHTAVTFYGGENVFVYKSTKANGHYIYSRYCWGD